MSIILEASADDARNASVVARNVSLRHIWLLNVDVRNDLPIRGHALDMPLGARVTHDVGKHIKLKDSAILVPVTIQVSFSDESRREENKAPGQTDTESAPVAVVRVDVGAEYQLPDGPVPDGIGESHFEAFARLNGPYNAWPYLREEVHRLSADMGIPFVVPVLIVNTVPAKKADPASETGG